MVHTPADISRISGSRLAIKGQFYLDTKGNKYKGTAEGRLEQVYTIDKTIAVKLNVDDKPQKLNEYLLSLKDTTEGLAAYDAFVTEYLNGVAYAQKTGYSEFNYTGDNLTEIVIYKDSTKVNLLFTKTLTYTGDNLTRIETINSDSSFRLIKEFTYDVNGNITTKTIL